MRSDTIPLINEIAALKAELAALRDKADAFDALSAMKGVEITQGGQTWAIWDTRGAVAWLVASGKTLAEAVRLAMEAEGSG